jgi:4-hydroxy-2-oxoheptanedioate aldolase
MKINTAKRKMVGGRPALGACVNLGSTLAAEALSFAGFDFVMVDCQHGAWDDAGAMQAFRAIVDGAAIPMVRVAGHDFYDIGRLLDRGALGIIVPMVNSAQEAAAVAHAVRYPPLGGRSFGPFGVTPYGEDYARLIDDEVLLAVQIETKEAAEHAEEILAVPGVDGCWIGPMDLARSMGVEPGSPAHEEALAGILQACRRTHKIPGIWATDDTRRRLEQGFLLVTAGSDITFLANGARRALQDAGLQPGDN